MSTTVDRWLISLIKPSKLLTDSIWAKSDKCSPVKVKKGLTVVPTILLYLRGGGVWLCRTAAPCIVNHSKDIGV